jgi:hypothetical protein
MLAFGRLPDRVAAVGHDPDAHAAVPLGLPALDPPFETGIGELGGEGEHGEDHDGPITNPRMNPG